MALFHFIPDEEQTKHIYALFEAVTLLMGNSELQTPKEDHLISKEPSRTERM